MEKKNWLARFRPLAVFPTPERDGSLEELLTTLYETGLQLEPVVSQMGFYKASVPDLNDEEKHLKRVVIKPSEISFENFMEENRKEYERLKQNKQPG